VKTTKPISTISYNTAPYLTEKLNSLKKAKIISIWHFIKHLPEDDEGGKKDHIHLYIEPNKLLDTADLLNEFKEIDLQNIDKPLGCMAFRSSSTFGDWYLYGIHDTAYLASKGQSRRYHYVYDDVQTSDVDELYRSYKEIDLNSIAPINELKTAIQDGLTFADLVSNGLVPLSQIRNYQLTWDLLTQTSTYRADRKKHS